MTTILPLTFYQLSLDGMSERVYPLPHVRWFFVWDEYTPHVYWRGPYACEEVAWSEMRFYTRDKPGVYPYIARYEVVICKHGRLLGYAPLDDELCLIETCSWQRQPPCPLCRLDQIPGVSDLGDTNPATQLVETLVKRGSKEN